MPRWAHRALLSSILGLGLISSACGSSGGGSPSTSSKGTINIASLAGSNSAESSILANVYGGALKADGWTVDYKLNFGSREVVEPALERGDIDLYPGYAAAELEFINKAKGEATSEADATVAKLNTYLEPKKLKALDPASATDENAFAVLKSGKYGSDRRLSDLTPMAALMTLGGPRECPAQPFCEAGLEKTYGLHFKGFKPLDAGGPLTKAALDRGDIDIGLVLSSDSAYSSGRYVQLQDDKHLQNADNVVPIGRSNVLTSDVASVLNRVSAKLTTEALIAMNRKHDVNKRDPAQIAGDWLKSNGFKTG
jgi:osmoprotectant transport system substrate-binding protein